MGKLAQFFADGDGQYSMTRLVYLLCFFASTYFISTINSDDAKVNALYAYMGAFIAGYVGGKGAEVWRGRPRQDAMQVSVNQPSSVNIPGA